MDDILTEVGLEICPICLMNLKSSLKECTVANMYLPCIRSSNPCKNYYQCVHSGKKRKINVECIRFYRQQDGLSKLKLSNPGRRRLLTQTFSSWDPSL